jgi:hypothetical protein
MPSADGLYSLLGKRGSDGLSPLQGDYIKIRRTTLVDSATSARTLTLPDQTATLATLNDISGGGYVTLAGNNTFTGINTFTNLTAVIFNNGINSKSGVKIALGGGFGSLITANSSLTGDTTLSLPVSSGTLALADNPTFFDTSSPTKQLILLLSGSSINSALTLATNQTTTQTLNIPNITSTDTLVVLGLIQTITATKSFTGSSGIVTSGVYPRTSNSVQQSSTFTTPAIQIGGSTNDGIYSSTTDVIDFGVQGTNYISLQPSGIYRFVGGTIDPAIVFNQRIQVMDSANGATSPAIQIDRQNSGFYRVNQGTIGIGISGVATGRWSSAGLNLFGVAGTAGAPAFVLNNDTTSGLFRPASNQIGISCGGTQVGKWVSTGLDLGSVGIRDFSNTWNLLIPTLAQNETIVTQKTIGILNSQYLSDSNSGLANQSDNTKTVIFSLASQTTGKYLKWIFNQTTSQDLNFPNITATDTLSTLGLSQTHTAARTFTGGVVVGSSSTTFNRIEKGTVTSGTLNMAQYGTVASISVTFANTFSSAPQVWVTLQNVAGTVSNGDNLSINVGVITTTGCTIYMKNSFNTTVTGTATVAYLAMN